MCYKAKYLLLNTGFAAKRYTPDWNGIETFRGTFIHPSYWPQEDLDLKGKKVAVIGTGSTGVQLATELSSIVGELVVFQRTPNTALPMKQVDYKDGQQALGREAYPDLFKGRPHSFSGFSFSPVPRNTFDDPPETRRAFYESLWEEGDFKFWLANYQDLLFVKAANDEAYAFWREKTCPRIKDPRVRDLLAPMAAPYSFGCKRISLEQGFFEIFNEPHVHLVDMNSTPIETFTEKGIKTSENEWEFDYIICATGFDSITGGLKQIDIKGISGEPLAEYWKNGTRTYLGMAVSGYPNLFFTYGPQGPTALCNGPTVSSPHMSFPVQGRQSEYESHVADGPHRPTPGCSSGQFRWGRQCPANTPASRAAFPSHHG
jgi:cation diffusion facilitator CzcD-associated flavoprotein CzcO